MYLSIIRTGWGQVEVFRGCYDKATVGSDSEIESAKKDNDTVSCSCFYQQFKQKKGLAQFKSENKLPETG